jgi:hypothetical protein
LQAFSRSAEDNGLFDNVAEFVRLSTLPLLTMRSSRRLVATHGNRFLPFCCLPSIIHCRIWLHLLPSLTCGAGAYSFHWCDESLAERFRMVRRGATMAAWMHGPSMRLLGACQREFLAGLRRAVLGL